VDLCLSQYALVLERERDTDVLAGDNGWAGQATEGQGVNTLYGVIAVMTFPTLFPNGQAAFALPCQRTLQAKYKGGEGIVGAGDTVMRTIGIALPCTSPPQYDNPV
jgi:hypothetical protein